MADEAPKLSPLFQLVEDFKQKICEGIPDPHTRADVLAVVMERLAQYQRAEYAAAVEWNAEAAHELRAKLAGVSPEVLRAQIIDETGADPEKVRKLPLTELLGLQLEARKGTKPPKRYLKDEPKVETEDPRSVVSAGPPPEAGGIAAPAAAAPAKTSKRK